MANSGGDHEYMRTRSVVKLHFLGGIKLTGERSKTQFTGDGTVRKRRTAAARGGGVVSGGDGVGARCERVAR